MKYNLSYKPFGAHAILIEWPNKIDEIILEDILIYKNKIEQLYIKPKVELISAYNSLTIIYNFTIENINDKILELKSIYNSHHTFTPSQKRLWEIPVCYDGIFAPDLEDFSKQKSRSESEIIELHSNQIYTVFFIGFLPGFLYLGGLDKSLHLDRKSTPNLHIKKGAVGIGGKQTGIYPQNSPGGWHIIGNSPIDFFDVKSENPCFAKPGDKLKFYPISKLEYEDILSMVTSGSFQLKSTVIHD